MQSLRPARLREIKPIDRWVVINFAAQILFDVGNLVAPGTGGDLVPVRLASS